MFEKMKYYLRLRYMKAVNLYKLKRYERKINKLWGKCLNLPEEQKYIIGEKLMYHEANLRHLKEVFATQL